MRADCIYSLRICRSLQHILQNLKKEVQDNCEQQKWSKSLIDWPKQNRPGKKGWKTWQSAMRTLVKEDGVTLRRPNKGEWLTQQNYSREWSHYYLEEDEVVCTSSGQTYELETALRNKKIYRINQNKAKEITRETMVPVHVGQYQTMVILDKWSGILREQPTENFIDNITYDIAVSDGSVRMGQGTYGWVKESREGDKEQGQGSVEGQPGLMTSCRSEAQGLVDLLWSGGVNAQTQIYLDNQAVVHKVNEAAPLHPLQSEWELVEPARKRVHEQHLKVQHVRGHQDKKQGQLTREEKLNVEADALTRKAHHDPQGTGYLPPGYGVLLYINGNRVTTKMVKELQRAATTPEIRLYYIKKHGWTDSDMDRMDWEAQYKASMHFSTNTQRMLHKYIHGWLPTGNHMHRRYNSENRCPMCTKPENGDHMILCTGQAEEKNIFKKQMNQMLKKYNTEPGLQGAIMRIMFSPEEVYTYDEMHIERVVQEQTRIGRQNLWKGFLTQTWRDVQEQWYRDKNYGVQHTGSLWAKTVIQEIFGFVVDTWARRNKALHDSTNSNPTREHLSKQIRTLYNKYRDTPEVLPCLYKYKLERLLRKSDNYLQKWYEIMQGMEVTDKIQRLRRPGRDIRQYLPMQERPPEQNRPTRGH